MIVKTKLSLCSRRLFYDFDFLNSHLRKQAWFSKNKIQEPNLLNFLDLVSLGTICDVIPLVGLNRANKTRSKDYKFKKPRIKNINRFM